MNMYEQLKICIIKEYPKLKNGYKIKWLGRGTPDIVIADNNNRHMSPVYKSFKELLAHYGIKEDV